MFLRETADERARFFRAHDESVELLAALLSDGRIRLADGTRRFAGMLANDQADVLEMGADAWSTVYLRVTPGGTTQIEIHGGPYDAHVLTCDPIDLRRTATS